MTREEALKEYIIKQYGTMQGFCLESGIPKSTLSTILQRGTWWSVNGFNNEDM